MALACNLLITHDAQHAHYAYENVRAALLRLGATATLAGDSPPGIFEVAFNGDPRAFVRGLREVAQREPELFAHTHHWRPVDAWVEADLRPMVQAIEGLAQRIGPEDTWRLTLDIHGPSPWHQRELVKPLTDPVQRGQVQLRDPDKELRVDVVRDQAGVALLERGDDLSVDRLAPPQEA